MSGGSSHIKESFQAVLNAVSNAAKARSSEFQDICATPRLVAVSKSKPKESLLEAYAYGQRHFGENYVQELLEKANDPVVQEQCPDIKFHFIGHLQRNKVKKLLSIVEKIFVIETVDTPALAKAINDELKNLKAEKILNVMVQVNTSKESSKHGTAADDCRKLAKFIEEDCEKLQLMGLMTIGAPTQQEGENQDFKMLRELRKEVCADLGKSIEQLELSMGMSNDFEEAIQMGSTNVRVGSKIFGARQQVK